MASDQRTPPDLLMHLRYVLNKVQHNLLAADLKIISQDTGISYSNLCRLRQGGLPSIPVLELLAYYFGPAPDQTVLDHYKQKREVKTVQATVSPPVFNPAPWN